MLDKNLNPNLNIAPMASSPLFYYYSVGVSAQREVRFHC